MNNKIIKVLTILGAVAFLIAAFCVDGGNRIIYPIIGLFVAFFSALEYFKEKLFISVVIYAIGVLVLLYGLAFYFTGRFIFVGYNLITVGMCCILYPAILLWRVKVFGYIKTTGECVDIERKEIILRKGGINETLLGFARKPVLKYVIDDSTYIVGNELYCFLGTPKRDSIVNIYVSPSNKEKYIRFIYEHIIICMVLGIVLILIGVVLI